MVCLFIRFFSFFSKFYCVFLHAILFLLYGFIDMVEARRSPLMFQEESV